MAAPHPVSAFLEATHLAPAQQHRGLSLAPIVLAPDSPPPALGYIPLSEGLRQGTVTVDEVSDDGSVPHVRVSNRGLEAVLFLFGEEISGAKQNRVANASFVVGPQSEAVLDVSCVEAGRWHRSPGRGFDGSDAVLSHALRSKMSRRVAESRARGERFHASQSEVWREIDERMAFAGARSSTSAYADYRSSRAETLDDFDRAFRCLDRQVGFVATISGRVHGVEVIGRPEVFRSSFRGLLHAYAVDAVDAALLERDAPPLGRDASAEKFLRAVAAADVKRSPSLGLGEDLRLTDPEVEGCALAAEGLIHLTAYPAPATPPGGGRRRRDSEVGGDASALAGSKAA